MLPKEKSDRTLPDSSKSVSRVFTEAFSTVPLEQSIGKCENYELAPLFKRILPSRQPILEAGCGAGRFVGWFARQGWNAAGIDWSQALCARARGAIPAADFVSGDLRSLPFRNGVFGSIVALGSIEHVSEGPLGALGEFRRVLRPGGLAIVTVPFDGPLSRFGRRTRGAVRNSRFVRRLFGKPAGKGRSLREARAEANPAWASDYVWGADGCGFFQYQFNRTQMRDFLVAQKFEILEEFLALADESLYHTFGKIAGRLDPETGIMELTPLGKALRFLIPDRVTGHMLCYVARRD